MKHSEIKLNIALDAQHVPDKIFWQATDAPSDGSQETKAFCLSIWEGESGAALKIDLWNKEMTVGEMKAFMIQTIGGMGETLFNATGDQKMKDTVDECCQTLLKLVVEEEERLKAGN